ncbi:hypothetical protein B0H16DRAFT_1539245 [Mycena metata]|uniref:DUF1365-domain-containing protein n=1 Tax=Mycena metata TaxID=1033252 RepID=A0AAD7J4M6_9AGAR|nr:hypothetical protein B0H16DRAFT_1539245 [Mycena metata]
MTGTPSYPRGYVLENQVTHARLFPVGSTHAFTYPTLSLLLSLNALENHSLDLGRGWIFGYGGRWARLFGLRPAPYLTENGGSIRQRLEKVLADRGLLGDGLEDAWMMTMPSLLGFEGINPLTVYFCYRPGGEFFLTVLEVHNTFGESHVYCLETGKGEDKTIVGGFDHQWTFPRAFHVSPFNDRRGFYRVAIKSPTHPPTGTRDTNASPTPPRPSVRVHLHTASDHKIPVVGPLKLTALLRPTSASPLTSTSLVFALSRAPFDLFLSFARIVYIAWILHYKKRLDVFIRPEPLPATWTSPESDPSLHPIEGGVRWLDEGLFEAYSRRHVEEFLRRRVEETGVSVSLVPANPSLVIRAFAPAYPPTDHLKISYLSPRVFTILLLCPSPQHALLLGTTERIFFASSDKLFHSTFAPPPTTPTTPTSRRQKMRAAPIGTLLPLAIPARNALDPPGLVGALVSVAVIWTLLFLDRVEGWVFRVARARPVKGLEPWKQWERAAMAYAGQKIAVPKVREGSVRRDRDA